MFHCIMSGNKETDKLTKVGGRLPHSDIDISYGETRASSEI